MSNCPMCGSSSLKAIFDHQLLKCSSCGHGVANLDLEALDLSAVYSASYFKGEEYDNYVKDEVGLRKNFSKRLRKFLTPNGNRDRFFEIGSAHGFFGRSAKDWNPECQYIGIDVSEDAIQWGKDHLELNLLTTDYLSFDREKMGSPTHVFMWDVIEHLKYPSKYVQKLAQEVDPNTEVFISTGDFGALLSRLQGKNWRMIHPPTHLHYFTKRSMRLMLENQGFEVKKFYYLPVWRSVRQIYYSLFILKKRKRKFHEKIYNSIPGKWFIPFNTFDIFIVKAVKK